MDLFWVCSECGATNSYPDIKECEVCGKLISEDEIQKSKETSITITNNIKKEKYDEEEEQKKRKLEEAELLRKKNKEKEELLKKKKAEEERKRKEEKEKQRKLLIEKRKKNYKAIKEKLVSYSKPIIIGLLIISLVGSPFYYFKVARPKNKYEKAVEYIEDKNYSKAIKILDKLDDYKDSEILSQKCRYWANWRVPLGTKAWKNGNNKSIWWSIKASKGSKYLLVAEEQIYWSEYSEKTGVSWKDSKVRKLLAEDYEICFTDNEKRLILTTKVITDGEATTKDKLFILSKSEYEYLGKISIEDEHRCWLRSEKGKYYYGDEGRIGEARPGIEDNEGVRPAMWVDIDYLSSNFDEQGKPSIMSTKDIFTAEKK